MEFGAAIIFLVLYFVRFHDWIPALSGLNVIKPVMALGLWGLISRSERTPKWKWFSTPHEWIMSSFLLYGLYTDPDWMGTFFGILPVAGFYFLTSQAVTSEDRIDRYFRWWAACVTFMCLVGVATDMGIDITGREISSRLKLAACASTLGCSIIQTHWAIPQLPPSRSSISR